MDIDKPFEYRGLDEVILKTFEKPVAFKYDPLIKLSMRFGVGLIFLQLAAIIINIKNFPDVVPFFYSLSWGEKRLADFRFLFALPLMSFIILFINFLIAKRIYNTERLLSRISILVGFIAGLLSLITLFQIIYVTT